MNKYCLKALTLITIGVLFASCSVFQPSDGTPDGDTTAFIRMSKGEYGGNFLGAVGLAAQGDYCQITISDPKYEWTSEDLAFWKGHCPPDSERERLVSELLRQLDGN